MSNWSNIVKIVQIFELVKMVKFFQTCQIATANLDFSSTLTIFEWLKIQHCFSCIWSLRTPVHLWDSCFSRVRQFEFWNSSTLSSFRQFIWQICQIDKKVIEVNLAAKHLEKHQNAFCWTYKSWRHWRQCCLSPCLIWCGLDFRCQYAQFWSWVLFKN